MNIKIKKTFLSLITALFFLGLYTCPLHVSGAAKNKVIVMNKKSLSLKEGDSFKLKVKMARPKKIGKSLKYTSKNKKIATVNKRGIVKAKNTGNTKVIVTSKKDKSIKVTIRVNVRPCKKQDKVISDSQGNTMNPDVSLAKSTPEPVNPSPQPSPAPVQDDTVLFKSTHEMYAYIISEQFGHILPKDGNDIIALDLSSCSSMSDTDVLLLAEAVSSKFCNTVINPEEALVHEGMIVKDDTYGFVFNGGILITINENMPKSTDFTFDISCKKNGLNGSFIKSCRAYNKDGGWNYELGIKGIS